MENKDEHQIAKAQPRLFLYEQFQDPSLFFNWNTFSDEEIGGDSKAILLFDPIEKCGKNYFFNISHL